MSTRAQSIGVADGVSLHAIVDEPDSRGDDHADFVLVHGLASNARMWDGVRTSLARRGHRVVAVDLRGHGRSDKPDDGYDIPTVARDVATLIERLDLDGPVVAGQSWGGNVALELAATVAPRAVRSIVLVDGGWIDLSHLQTWDEVVGQMAPPRLVGRPFVEVEQRTREAHPEWPESGIQGALACYEVREDGTIAPWLTYDRHLLVLRGLWEHRPASLYPLVHVPVVLAACESDRRDDRKRAAVDAARHALRHATVKWFHADHDVHAQYPEAVADLLAEATSAACEP